MAAVKGIITWRATAMSISIKANSKLKFLHVVATGHFSLFAGKKGLIEVFDAVVRHKAERVLFDGRRVKGGLTTAERVEYAEFAAKGYFQLLERGVSHLPHFAYVLWPPILDPRRIGRIVAVNRGVMVEVFTNIEKAVQWLGLPSSAGEPGAACRTTGRQARGGRTSALDV